MPVVIHISSMTGKLNTISSLVYYVLFGPGKFIDNRVTKGFNLSLRNGTSNQSSKICPMVPLCIQYKPINMLHLSSNDD